MGDHLLHPLTPARRRLRAAVTGPRLVLLAGAAGFAVAVLVLGSRNHAAAAAATGGRPAAVRQQPGVTINQEAAGRQLFLVHCSSCHGFNGEGTGDGPPLLNAGAGSADFFLRTGRMPLSDPRQQPTRHAPAFPPGQIADLVAYVGSLGSGPPIPSVLPGDLSGGRDVFTNNCAQCHNIAGAGGALGSGDIIPDLRHANALDVVEAARVGPAPMPVFGPQTLSDQQVSDVAAYVQYLHHPEDRGGLGLGHLGPIPEGFVGWVVGMGALLLITRLIGTRA